MTDVSPTVEGISARTLRWLRFEKLENHVIVGANTLDGLLNPGVNMSMAISPTQTGGQRDTHCVRVAGKHRRFSDDERYERRLNLRKGFRSRFEPSHELNLPISIPTQLILPACNIRYSVPIKIKPAYWSEPSSKRICGTVF